jgi:hypothetical protein
MAYGEGNLEREHQASMQVPMLVERNLCGLVGTRHHAFVAGDPTHDGRCEMGPVRI